MINTEILIIDFGSQYTQLLARRIRSLGYYVDVISCTTSATDIQRKYPNVKALILSGGPCSVYENNSYTLDAQIWSMNVNVLGICYGMQLMIDYCGGRIDTGSGQYGSAQLSISKRDVLLESVPDNSRVWMSHSDQIHSLPDDFDVLGISDSYISVIKHKNKNWWGLQFHPEVEHTLFGNKILENFIQLSGLTRNWDLGDFIENKITEIKETVGDNQVLLGFSGGVDSFITGVLINKAIGNQLHCVLVDHGLLGSYSVLDKVEYIKQKYNLNIVVINAKDQFFRALKGITDPDTKRKIIGKEFINVFDSYQKHNPNISFLAQGTIYSDVIESAHASKQQKVIKNHHNVGGLPDKLNLKLIEPIRHLFKDEVREIGKRLNVDDEIINVHPFPGPGLGIRVVGEVSEDKCDLLRKIDHIFISALKEYNLYDKVSQAGVIVLPVKSVGVKGDCPTYGYTCVLRAVKTSDFMTADVFPLDYQFLSIVSTRIVNNIPDITRVLYDITSKPPGTIEWE